MVKVSLSCENDDDKFIISQPVRTSTLNYSVCHRLQVLSFPSGIPFIHQILYGAPNVFPGKNANVLKM